MKLTKHGFTLTELMAVVIIIGILAGIGFGSYQKAIERSRFSEGLAAGAAVQEAVNRYYYENTDLASSARKYPKIAYLDISLANAKDCATKSDYCVRTKYFEVIVSNSGSVYAYHMKGTTRQLYYLLWLPSFGSERKSEACAPFGSNATEGADFCKSMGYTSKPASGSLYYKP